MKKIIFSFIFLLFALNSAFAVEYLYTLQNVKKDNVKPYIENALSGYNIAKKDPYWAVSSSNSEDYVAIILQKSGNDVLYYYNSSKNKKAAKNILNSFKNAGILYNLSDDENYKNIFNNQVQNINSAVQKTYNFDVWSNTEPANAIYKNEDDDTTLKGSIIQVAKGTTFNVYLQTPINTATARAGDSIQAILSQDFIYNGYKIASQGSVLSGTLSKARSAKYGSLNGRVILNFDTLSTPENKTYKLSTEEIDFTVTNDGKISKSVKNVATGAIIGALGGLIVGALSHDASIGKAVLIGTGIGAASGTVSSVAERGVDAEIPIYTVFEIKTTKPFKAVFY